MKKLLTAATFVAIAFVLFSFASKKPSPKDIEDLVFPVAGKKSNVGSFWGASRDGGKRKHEGIDIFARKGTAVVAIADGVITSSGNTKLGGKVLWLRPEGTWWTAYYAHLDKQLVKEGDRVTKGQVIGTVGNTGNAKYTPAHLHFGIYTWQGAINPYPVVKNAPKIAIPGQVNDPKVMMAKKERVKEKKQVTAPVAKVASFPKQYIYKTVTVPSDPSADYYVTTRSNVVRVEKGKLQVVGKWLKAKDSRYPYHVALANNSKLYVSKAGKLVTAKGVQVGTVI